MEQRRESDNQIGYLTSKVESLLEMVAQNSERLTRLEDNVAEKFTTIETAFKVVKFVALAVVAVATFQFGDIAKLWASLFG